MNPACTKRAVLENRRSALKRLPSKKSMHSISITTKHGILKTLALLTFQNEGLANLRNNLAFSYLTSHICTDLGEVILTNLRFANMTRDNLNSFEKQDTQAHTRTTGSGVENGWW